MKCSECAHWLLQRKNVYESGEQIVTYSAPEGKGHCKILDLDVNPEFGCLAFSVGEHIEVTNKSGTPWQHWVQIKCPECNGNPGDYAGIRCRCAGTGKVKLYDDGYIGSERNQGHPKENALRSPDKPNPGHILKPIRRDGVMTHGGVVFTEEPEEGYRAA